MNLTNAQAALLAATRLGVRNDRWPEESSITTDRAADFKRWLDSVEPIIFPDDREDA
jgi:hypothetical protein